MSNNDTHDTVTEDLELQEVLEETVFNERIVKHHKLGEIKLRHPTLAVQRKIDSAVRAKRKQLLTATDEITNDDGTTQRVPAFKSREALMKEYSSLGWWTPEQELKRNELNEQQLTLITTLEVLGFKTEEDLYDQLNSARQKLQEHFEDIDDKELSEELELAVLRITVPGEEPAGEDYQLVHKHATSSDVDNIIEELKDTHRLTSTYYQLIKITSELASLETEYMSLFSDSWQEQLQYYQRIAQVYYCSTIVSTGNPLWPNIEAVENDEDITLVRWVFTELTAFWQGITPEMREKMKRYNFMERLIERPESSEDSLDQPESNEDGSSQENKPTPSTEVMDTTEN